MASSQRHATHTGPHAMATQLPPKALGSQPQAQVLLGGCVRLSVCTGGLSPFRLCWEKGVRTLSSHSDRWADLPGQSAKEGTRALRVEEEYKLGVGRGLVGQPGTGL